MSEVCLLICLERGFCFFVCRWEVYPSLRENKPPPLYETFLFCHNIQIFSTQVCGKQIFTAYIYIFPVLDIPLNGPSHTLKTNRLTHQE